jgi:ribose-phosphate pyrophosphokinase
MNNVQLFALPGNEALALELSTLLDFDMGKAIIRRFPDGETYVNVESDVRGAEIYVLASLHQPDDKFLPLYFLCRTLKELGAYSVKLIAPYLAYMRQDKRFNPGECITSDLFARLLSGFIDELITIDPHLHRHNSMGELYTIPVKVLHASRVISEWIKTTIPNAILVGPDEESKQWVAGVAKEANKPFIVLQKVRRGDKNVSIQVPDVSQWKNHTPVLIDDIISTARTMIETIRQLQSAGFREVICIGVHGIFSGDAYKEVLQTGARVFTTNSIAHETNNISIVRLIANAISSNCSINAS